MADLLKRSGQLVLLRIVLCDDATTVTPASVVIEVQLTGDPSERRLASVYGDQFRAQEAATSDEADLAAIGALTRVTISAAELGIPVDPLLAVRMQERSDTLVERGATALEGVVTKYLPEWRADALIRFARERSGFEPKLTLPPAAVRQLSEALRSVLTDGEVLWLEFGETVGYLPLIPWEEALRSVTSAPVLRLTPHALEPIYSRHELSTALCCSVPSPEMLPTPRAMRDILLAIQQHLPPQSRVHVFADALARPLIEQLVPSLGADNVVHLHPLPEVASRGGDIDAIVGDELRRGREHPWVTWICKSLGGEAVDLVHWISPGVFPDEGVLLAADPAAYEATGDGARTLRFVPVPALAEFLNDVGAWGAIFSAFGPRQSTLGLRATTDRFARLRPGPAAMHDLTLDPASTALAELYGFLIKGGSASAPRAPGMLLYTHPARTGAAPRMPSAGPTEASSTTSLLDAYDRVASATGSVIDRTGPTPAWVASAQRIAEQSVSRVVSSSRPGEIDPVAAAGMTAALAALQRVLEHDPQRDAVDVSQGAQDA